MLQKLINVAVILPALRLQANTAPLVLLNFP